ncbi:uncharacterized protein EAF02_001373 [Botrytis sinoallii]|uniref:uncharacterized protein n=1 Tax=Botrytis sinoallii TaxID=1463999 RepID=UPI00190033B5|nr:uncharacterized protein EAF02_001373 [Botrytis sinoallii]KAF7891048.1 hypothetical protein EAF02_001373 [Botrytis sinoallii]
MYCAECGHPLPDIRDDNTTCSKCKTRLGTWWDESSKTMRTNREAFVPTNMMSEIMGGRSHFEINKKVSERTNTYGLEERGFLATLTMLEMRWGPGGGAGLGRKTMEGLGKMIRSTLDMSLSRGEVREALAKNVDIWMRLQRIFYLAVPILVSRSLRESYSEQGVPAGPDVSESVALILKNFEVLTEDLGYLNNLLVVSRNMLAVKETAQEICRAVGLDKQVHKLIILCVNVTSKGYDGENVDDNSRGRLNEVTELYKKLLVTCLQHTHNWTMGNDRFKMSFWFDMLFDNDLHNDPVHELPPDDLNVEKVYHEVRNWLARHSADQDETAKELLEKYAAEADMDCTPGPLPQIDEFTVTDADKEDDPEETTPVWKPELTDKYEQDRIYARVSHEIDIWWKRQRDQNYEGWVVKMVTVEDAIKRAEACKETAMERFLPQRAFQDQDAYDQDEQLEEPPLHDEIDGDTRSMDGHDGEDDGEEEDEEDDDESYAEGPLRGLLTEIPNILDTKQIEALHMTVKACIVDSMGSGLTPAGENLQKTRCKMFLALDCGKNLLREMLVFIAVWEQTDQHFIFQITAQIIESFHHNALLPYAWSSLRIMKDIVSPAQTVLLRLINYMFRARKDSPIYDDLRDYNRDAKLIHFLFTYFRTRVVPDCIALIHAQAQIRTKNSDPNDFPVDLWDMERAKDGLSQYLDFISVIAEIPEMRPLLIEWEAVYELIALLRALDLGVAKKNLSEQPLPNRRQAPVPQQGGGIQATERPYESPTSQNAPQFPGQGQSLPPLHDTPHKFPWSGIKIQILIILTSLVAPNNPRRQGPGNPIVQKQLLNQDGIMPLLNCCVYDGHNEYLKERATLALKYVMEGCEEAQKWVKDLVPAGKQRAAAGAGANGAQGNGNANGSGSGSGSGNSRAGGGVPATTSAASNGLHMQMSVGNSIDVDPTLQLEKLRLQERVRIAEQKAREMRGRENGQG